MNRDDPIWSMDRHTRGAELTRRFGVEQAISRLHREGLLTPEIQAVLRKVKTDESLTPGMMTPSEPEIRTHVIEKRVLWRTVRSEVQVPKDAYFEHTVYET